MPRGRPRKNPDDVLLRSADLIGWALGGIEREILQTRERLASLSSQAAKLRARLGRPETGPGATTGAGAGVEGESTGRRGRRRRRRMSPEARKRISEMMKKRWAERRKRNA